MASNKKPFRIAIIGGGTVGGGVARILAERSAALERSAGRPLELAAVATRSPARSAERYGIPLAAMGGKATLGAAELAARTDAILADPSIDLIVESVGGTGDHVRSVCLRALESGKHLVTANKALLAERGDELFGAAKARGVALGFEAAVCGAIPVIRVVREGFAGDEVESLSGIMNGTSNYILSKMTAEGLSFEAALKQAQDAGYAEADPTLDVGGGDAGHKLSILVRLAFGLGAAASDLSVSGVTAVSTADLVAAKEMDCVVKLICHAQKDGNTVYAAVCPMMVKKSNVLSRVDGATNAVRSHNRYSGDHLLVGKGAGSTETGSAIVADIVAAARYGSLIAEPPAADGLVLKDMDELPFPYTVIFDTADMPGITGLVTTAIGDEGINIDTVGHNMHSGDAAVFAVLTMPCARKRIRAAVERIRAARAGVYRSEPKIYPVLF